MISFKNIISVFTLLLLPYLTFAQQDLPSGEVEVIKNFDARLLDTEKLRVIPELPPLDTTTQTLFYSIPSKNITVEYLPPKIRPVAMRTAKLGPTYKGYVKAGYGTPNSPYFEGGYRDFINEQYDIGIYAKHHSANFKDIANQRFSNTMVNLDGTYFMDEGIAVNANVGYTQDEVHFYGIPPSDSLLTREQVRQIFKTFNVGAKMYNDSRNQGDINYEAGFNYSRISDNYASEEGNFDINLGMTKWINETHPVTLNLITEFTKFQDTAKQNLNNFFLQPSFTFHGDAFKVKAGINLASHNDEYFLLPDIEATANIIGSQLTVFVGWEGDLYKNNFQNLTDYNPFIVSRPILENTKYHQYYGGVKGNIKGISYSGQVGYKTTNNLALFLNDENDPKRFQVLYDSVNIFNIKGTVSTDIFSGLQLIGTLSQSVYDPKNEEKAWHLPSLEANVTAKYLMLAEKLTIKGELYIANGVPYIDENRNTDNLNALFDVSAGAEYQINKNFGAFLDINNLAANKRQRWYRYPSYGINVLVGITAVF